MFDRIFRRAERKIDSVVSKYVRRAIVAVPLLIASLFATAAASVKLVEMYGAVNGYGIMAAGFLLLSAVVALFAFTGDLTPVEEAEAKAEDAEKVKQSDESPLVPPELLSLIMAAAPVALPRVARTAARNLPIIVALAIIGYLFSRYASNTSGPDAAAGDSGDTDVPAAPSTASSADRDARVDDVAATMATRAAAA